MGFSKQEAIERIRRRICCEQPVAHFCRDDCMCGAEECEIAMALAALEEQIENERKGETKDVK